MTGVSYPFRLTHAQALELSRLSPLDRSIRLQGLYRRWLHDEATRRAGALICPPYAQLAIAKRIDREWREMLAEAEAEYARALAERSAA